MHIKVYISKGVLVLTAEKFEEYNELKRQLDAADEAVRCARERFLGAKEAYISRIAAENSEGLEK